MKTKKTTRAVFCLFLFTLAFPGFITAQDKRSIPLDLVLIIDDSSFFAACKSTALDWINRELVEAVLADGDSLTIWAAGDDARVIYKDSVKSQKEPIRNSLKTLQSTGKKAEFAKALAEASAGSKTDRSRFNMIMLVSGSAAALSASMSGSADLFRWSRVDEYAGWQVLVAAPGIGNDVQKAVSAYMNIF